MADPAGFYDVEMIDCRFLAGLRLDIMRGAVAARADRAVRGLLPDDVFPVYASLVGFIDVGMALGACSLRQGIDLALRRNLRSQFLRGLVRLAREALVLRSFEGHVALNAIKRAMNRLGVFLLIYIDGPFHRSMAAQACSRIGRSACRRNQNQGEQQQQYRVQPIPHTISFRDIL